MCRGVTSNPTSNTMKCASSLFSNRRKGSLRSIRRTMSQQTNSISLTRKNSSQMNSLKRKQNLFQWARKERRSRKYSHRQRMVLKSWFRIRSRKKSSKRSRRKSSRHSKLQTKCRCCLWLKSIQTLIKQRLEYSRRRWKSWNLDNFLISIFSPRR